MAVFVHLPLKLPARVILMLKVQDGTSVHDKSAPGKENERKK
jgi:hypothetical protein